MSFKTPAVFQVHPELIIICRHRIAVRGPDPAGGMGRELFQEFAVAVKDVDESRRLIRNSLELPPVIISVVVGGEEFWVIQQNELLGGDKLFKGT